jgi:Short C-terminal domain
VVAGTASVVAGNVRHHQDQKWAQQSQEQYAQQQAELAAQQPAAAAPAPAAAPDEPEYMAELQKLAQLKEQGILTEEEFQAKKKQLLGI